ncbi:MAG TPA: cupin domain-containing protein, partial [Bacilli bacterium]
MELKFFNRDGNHFPIFANHIKHGLTVGLHHHACIEIAYFIKGSATHIYKGQSMFMTAGDLVIIPSGSEHCYIQNHSVDIVNCLFLPEVLQSDIEWFQKTEGFFELFIAEPFFRSENNLRDKLTIPEEEREKLEFHFLEITRETEEASSGYEIAAKTHLFQLMLMLCRIYTTQKKASTAAKGSIGKASLVREAIQY